jgi:hypothetical protein
MVPHPIGVEVYYYSGVQMSLYVFEMTSTRLHKYRHVRPYPIPTQSIGSADSSVVKGVTVTAGERKRGGLSSFRRIASLVWSVPYPFLDRTTLATCFWLCSAVL